MMLTSDVIRAAIPNADESICEHILWGRTAFPFIPLTAKDIYRCYDSLNKYSKQRREKNEFL